MNRKLVTIATIAAVYALPSLVSANSEVQQLTADPNNWAIWGGNYAGQRYSELDQINAENVGDLQVAWTFSTGVLRGHEGGPLVVGDTLYIHTPFPNKVFAIDLNDQTIIWKYEPKQDPSVIPVMCCDTVSRGLAYADGKIFLQQADTTLVALNAQSGEVVWSVKNGDPKKGETNTNAPVVINDKIITGISGGEYGVRGFVAAYNTSDGSLAWKGYSVGPDDEMLIDPEKTTHMGKPVGPDSSISTWEGDQWKIGGGTTWGWFTYDPDLNLVYYGSGNPGTWNPVVRPGDNRWSMTLFARDVDTGMAKWVYQMTPHDEWDYDGVNENILADIEINGEMRKVMVHFDRNGFAYTLDRATGELLVAEKYDPAVNWATHVDMETGRPQVVAEYSTHQNGEDVNSENICPAALGSKDQQPSAFSPKTGLFYVPTNHVC
ncbi:MAG: PQQ-dependent dehydrogenase, methanol/ethanol family, partial [Candidatus Competibacteraceae bacterium]|nr:PQQ-dependent dehydrogenase, methanol/ethanol family [Candidatus Competibacteraceae bacterium]